MESNVRMAQKRRTRSSFKEDRQMIQMAEASATLEEAAAAFRTSIETIERKAKHLSLPVKGRGGQKRLSARFADGLGAKGE
jgi:hypothetical protein